MACQSRPYLRSAENLWEQTLVAIGGVAVVNRLAHFYLKICGVWITAAARQIATKVCSHKVIQALAPLASDHRISNKSAPNFGISFGSGSPGAAAQPFAGNRGAGRPARYESNAHHDPVASSLGCETGRRTVVWIRSAGAAAQPIAGCTPTPTGAGICAKP